jgi:hypothetical protein
MRRVERETVKSQLDTLPAAKGSGMKLRIIILHLFPEG